MRSRGEPSTFVGVRIEPTPHGEGRDTALLAKQQAQAGTYEEGTQFVALLALDARPLLMSLGGGSAFEQIEDRPAQLVGDDDLVRPRRNDAQGALETVAR